MSRSTSRFFTRWDKSLRKLTAQKESLDSKLYALKTDRIIFNNQLNVIQDDIRKFKEELKIIELTSGSRDQPLGENCPTCGQHVSGALYGDTSYKKN